MKRYIKIVLCCMLIANESNISATTFGLVGANVTTTYQTASQTMAAGANVMQGFCALAGGIAWTATAALTYAAIGGIGGVNTFNTSNHIITLSNDLVLLSGITFAGTGFFNIVGNNHALLLPVSNATFNIPKAMSITSASVVVNSPLSLSAAMTFL